MCKCSMWQLEWEAGWRMGYLVGFIASGCRDSYICGTKSMKKHSTRVQQVFSGPGCCGYKLVIGVFSMICIGTNLVRLWNGSSCRGWWASLRKPSFPSGGFTRCCRGLLPWGFQDAPFYLVVLGFDKLPLWGTILISVGCAVFSALFVWFFVCPRMKRRIERK